MLKLVFLLTRHVCNAWSHKGTYQKWRFQCQKQPGRCQHDAVEHLHFTRYFSLTVIATLVIVQCSRNRLNERITIKCCFMTTKRLCVFALCCFNTQKLAWLFRVQKSNLFGMHLLCESYSNLVRKHSRIYGEGLAALWDDRGIRNINNNNCLYSLRRTLH